MSEKMLHNQRVRAEMRKHGLTEVFEGVYSAGDMRDQKLAAVHVDVAIGASDADLAKACQVAADAYRAKVAAP